jgi:asparagine synthase (glutamine-hydrolysing)
MLVENGRGKVFLRDVLCDWLPSEMVERPKMGFGVPLGQWLRGPLREWAWDSLRSASRANLDSHSIQYFSKLYDQHLTGERDWSSKLWCILMYVNWCTVKRQANNHTDGSF